MNIIEAREAALAGKTVISPMGVEWTKRTFSSQKLENTFSTKMVFGEWKLKQEPVVFEADVAHLSMSDCVVMYCEDIRHLIGKKVRVSVEVIE